jgi:hypothetical protein
MKLVALLAVVVIGGCAHTHTSVNAGTGSVSGTTTTGGAVSVHGHSDGLAALVIAGMFIAAAADYSQNPPPPRFSSFADWFRGTPPTPEMDPSRRINEQDCTKPVDFSAGNLRCK